MWLKPPAVAELLLPSTEADNGNRYKIEKIGLTGIDNESSFLTVNFLPTSMQF